MVVFVAAIDVKNGGTVTEIRDCIFNNVDSVLGENGENRGSIVTVADRGTIVAIVNTVFSNSQMRFQPTYNGVARGVALYIEAADVTVISNSSFINLFVSSDYESGVSDGSIFIDNGGGIGEIENSIFDGKGTYRTRGKEVT